MSRRLTIYGLVAVLTAIAAYWYWSPLLVIRQMSDAAKAGDADRFNVHVDYPRLRESLKGQLSASLTKRLGATEPGDNDVAKAGVALGTMLGLVLVDKMVDTFVQPETVMRALQEGRMLPKGESDQGPMPSEPRDNGPRWQMERIGVDKLVAYAARPGQAEDKRVALVLERSGFAVWKLTEIRLPALQ